MEVDFFSVLYTFNESFTLLMVGLYYVYTHVKRASIIQFCLWYEWNFSPAVNSIWRTD